MGVLPLQFLPGQDVQSLNINGREIFRIAVSGTIQPGQEIAVEARSEDGMMKKFNVLCRLDTAIEVDCYRHGGILLRVLRSFLRVPGQ
jgi:aconitate hydratase